MVAPVWAAVAVVAIVALDGALAGRPTGRVMAADVLLLAAAGGGGVVLVRRALRWVLRRMDDAEADGPLPSRLAVFVAGMLAGGAARASVDDDVAVLGRAIVVAALVWIPMAIVAVVVLVRARRDRAAQPAD